MRREVSVIDNLFTGKVENLQSNLKDGKIKFFKGDIRDGKLVNELVKSVEAVVHLAAVSSVPFSVDNPVLTNDVNVNGTLNLLKACWESDVKKFVFISSCSVYGEPQYLPVNEEHPTQPLSPYAASKVAAEAYCKAFREAYGLDTVVLRLFNVYGPRQREEDVYSGVITKFANNLTRGKPLVIYGDGNQTRDFVHVEDVVEAVWLTLESEDAVGETFNIGSGKATSINELAKLLAEIFRVEAEAVHGKPRAGDLRRSYADIAKAKKALGYKPKIGLEHGLKSLTLELKGKASEHYE
jgi:UDP-glucose 4-epimerase